MNRRMLWVPGLVCLVCMRAMAADVVVVEFGSAPSKVGEVDNKRPDGGGSITFEKDCMVIEAPNFWSTFFQVSGGAVTLAEMKDATLYVSAKGSIADEGPVLRLICHNKDWSRSSEWLIDLSKINADIFSDAKATTSIAEPVATQGGGLQETDTLAGMQVFTKATKGNQPWTLKVKALGAK